MKLRDHLNEKNFDKKDVLRDIDKLRKRLDEVEAIVKSDESPFRHLSYIKTEVKELMDKIFPGKMR